METQDQSAAPKNTLTSDVDQEKICEYCQEYIIEGHAITPTFMCEGRYCDQAREEYEESLLEDN